MSNITQADLIAALSYDSGTGDFLRSGRLTKDGYRRIRVLGKEYMAHRLAWLYTFGEWPKGQIDHIDGDKLNNAIGNLRIVSASENKQNVRRAQENNKSGLLGVYQENGRWKSSIGLGNRKTKKLGCFDSAQAAHDAYLAAKRRLHAGCTL